MAESILRRSSEKGIAARARGAYEYLARYAGSFKGAEEDHYVPKLF